MLFLPRFAPLIFSLFVLMPLSFTPATAYDQSPEILGLKLGMSPTDAENTIRAQRPDLTIKIDKQFFTLYRRRRHFPDSGICCPHHRLQRNCLTYKTSRR